MKAIFSLSDGEQIQASRTALVNDTRILVPSEVIRYRDPDHDGDNRG